MSMNGNRNYGTVTGLPGVAYEDRDGRLYNFREERVNMEGEVIPDVPVPGAKAEAKPKPASAKKEKTVEVAGFQVPADMVEEQEPLDDFIADGVNLSAYSRGEEKVQFFKLKQVVEKAFGVKVTNGDEVHEVLRREGIAEPEPDEPPEGPDEPEDEAA